MSDFLAEPGEAPSPAAAIELELPTSEVGRLWRAPALTRRRAGRARTAKAATIWHDTPDNRLAIDGISLGRDHGSWRLERLLPGKPTEWLPAHRAPLLAQGPALEALDCRLPGQLLPIAAFEGRLRTVALDAAAHPLRLTLLEGTLRGVAQERSACRLILEGEMQAIATLAGELGSGLPLAVPRAGLAAQAMAVARGLPAQPRQIGAPAIPPGTSLDEAITWITAHLADVILHWSTQVPGGSSTEPVHQMRVGVRRLRSALTVFRRVNADDGGSPWLDRLAGELRDLATQLGAARDWDVFLNGAGAEIAHAFAGDRRVTGLLAAAARRRAAAYAELEAFLRTRAWPGFELDLALLPSKRPWSMAAGADEGLAAPARLYAERALDRRLKHVLGQGQQLDQLPHDLLHERRKQIKKLRYATEFFARLFPEKAVRKYLARLERLQAVLGMVNDRAQAASLLQRLGGGTDRAFACGVVLGFGAGQAVGGEKELARTWAKFARTTPFWD